MRLYRIMLVDDEAEVRESIVRKIDWESAGFQLAGDAENGLDALEKMEILEPDIVLTDIRMPYMDGLELASQIHQSYPSVKIMIFSGFDEFEYAKQAIHNGVIDYILKPVNADELTAILVKTKQILDDELRRRRNVEALREAYFKSMPVLREQALYDLTHGALEEARIPLALKEYGIEIADASYWTAAQLVTDKPQVVPRETGLPDQDEALKAISVQRVTEELLGKYTKYVTFRSSRGICAIAALESKAGFSGLIAVFNDICRECKRALELTVTAGIGQVVDSLSKLPLSYRESVEAVGYKAIMGAGEVIYIGDVERGYKPLPVLDKHKESNLISAIKFGTEKEVSEAVADIIGDFESARPHLSHLQFYAIGIVNALLRLASNYELDLVDIFGNNADFWAALSAVSDTGNLTRLVMKIAARLSGCIGETRRNSTRYIVEEAKRIIGENYKDAYLSLESVCANLHISSAYFSTVFKRETGQSYVNYLTQVRLDKAIELLTQTDEKTYLIAEQVGYTDPNYFSYVFKRRYGVSPTKYRSAI